MSKKQDMFYFEKFIESAEASCEAAQLLKRSLENFRPEDISKCMDEIHEVEHMADQKRHQIMDNLARAFIVPIEREDIASLGDNIDEVVDKLEDVLLRLYINNVQEIREDAVGLMDVVSRCCEEMKNMMKDFADFRHSKTLKSRIIRINELEEEADRLFVSSMRKLHETEPDPLKIIAWREIYNYMENCADACAHVADTVQNVVIKNS